MRSINLAALSLALVFIGVSVYAFIVILNLDHERGNLYQPYSTYRSDPLGARVLYEALEQLPGIDVSRNTQELTKFDQGDGATLVIAGSTRGSDPLPLIEHVEKFIHDGGRLIVSFSPYAYKYDEFPSRIAEKKKTKSRDKGDKDKDKKTDAGAPPAGNQEGEGEGETTAKEPRRKNAGKAQQNDDEGEDDESEDSSVDIEERWGFSLIATEHTGKADEPIQLDRCTENAGLPPTTFFWTRGYFKATDSAWKPIYCYGDKPAIMERAMGKGSIVLCSDCYLLSNEAMLNHRQPALIGWLLGSSSRIVFDETHLGVTQDLTIMNLMKRYRLQGVLATFVLLAFLYIWKNAATFTPRHGAEHEHEQRLQDQKLDPTSGLVKLLRRGVVSSQIVGVCFQEWERSAAARKATPRKLARMKIILAADNAVTEPLTTYHALQAALNEEE